MDSQYLSPSIKDCPNITIVILSILPPTPFPYSVMVLTTYWGFFCQAKLMCTKMQKFQLHSSEYFHLLRKSFYVPYQWILNPASSTATSKATVSFFCCKLVFDGISKNLYLFRMELIWKNSWNPWAHKSFHISSHHRHGDSKHEILHGHKVLIIQPNRYSLSSYYMSGTMTGSGDSVSKPKGNSVVIQKIIISIIAHNSGMQPVWLWVCFQLCPC